MHSYDKKNWNITTTKASQRAVRFVSLLTLQRVKYFTSGNRGGFGYNDHYRIVKWTFLSFLSGLHTSRLKHP